MAYKKEYRKQYKGPKEDFDHRKGLELYKKRKYEEALLCFKKSIEKQTDYLARSIFFVGKIYSIQKRYKEAEKEFKKCIEIDRENKHARLELGRLYARQEGREEEAEKEFKKYIEIDKDRTPHARLELGRLYARQEGREEEAEKKFKKYIEIDKYRTPHARLELGRLYTSQGGREEEAEEECKKCLEIDENHEYAKKQLQKLYKQKENSKSFVEQLEEHEDDELTLIRSKIHVGTISNNDIPEILEKIKDIDKKQAYLIQIAIYEKLGQKRNAINVVKQIKEEGIQIKGLGAIEERLKSKKTQLFDLDRWDQVIGWRVSRTEQYEEEERKKEDQNKQQNITASKNREISVAVQELPQEESKKERVVSKYITSSDIVANTSVSAKIKTNNNTKKEKAKKGSVQRTIETDLSEALKETISKINCYYYVHMQPQNSNKIGAKEHENLKIQIVNAKKDKMKIEQIKQELKQKMLKNDYEEASRQEKYIKKYDKLQSILGCDTNNKRAQMELMLVLINEGYREVVKREFPEKDYEFVDEIIKGYYAKTIKPQDAKKEIDEYCM